MKKTKRVIAIDCETDPFCDGEQVFPFLWGAYDGTDYREWADTAAIAEWLKEQDAIVYAHNGGHFDYMFLLDYAAAGSPVTVISGRLAKWRLGLAEMRDSYNVFPLPLKAFAKESIDYAKFERAQRDANMGEISRYLRSDCVNLWTLITEFRNNYGSALTIAGAALHHCEAIMGAPVEHSDAIFHDFFKPWYFGGRVQAFSSGVHRGRMVMADVVSAYPAAMLEQHPAGLQWEDVSGAVRGPDFLEIQCNSQGTFPVREDSGRLVYPVGPGVFHVTGWEYLAAKECGLLQGQEVKKHLRFIRTESFAPFILQVSARRLAAKAIGEKAQALFLKLIEVSVYGKLAADPRRYREQILMPWGEVPASGWIGKWSLVDVGPAKNSHFLNLATAASITGFQRAKLMRAIASVECPLYCDTDSVLCRSFGDLRTGSALGEWERQGEYAYAAIAGKKLYALRTQTGEWKTASKGVRLTPDEIVRVAKGETVKWTKQAPSMSVRTGYRRIVRNVRSTV